ncbi:amidase domain protein [Metarhizium robertsii]|uniref:amidase n=1 Tax=Metarhizium robertsii TaxID=568076 RepID=A0A0A1UX50_9HYPO|nr:amidase domain protein [Metarhizium robertsii]
MTVPDESLSIYPWEARAIKKRQQRNEAIPEEWRLRQNLLGSLKTPLERSKNNLMELNLVRQSGILTDKELQITESSDVTNMLEALASGQLTAEEVTVSFCKRAAVAHQLTNCLTEIFFDRALERARYLDRQKGKGQLVGPLHGLPISLKDSFQIAGVASTLGLTAYLDHRAESNSALVDILLALGAVLYCKTNVPQTMMTPDSHNFVFGRTLNPWNTSLSAGGSSGGEGALIAMRGAPIGVGTDIAGSIRVPALCCGTYGFRPTASRIPYGGQHGCADEGLAQILPCAGPLANDMKALSLFVKAVLQANPASYDASALDVNWRDVQGQFGRKLRFGLLPEDPTYPLHPPVRRTVAEASRLLQASGHEVVELQSQECRISEALQVAFALFALDETADGIVKAAGEPPIPSRIRIGQEMGKAPQEFVSDLRNLSELKQLSGLNLKRQELISDWCRLWQKYEIDAVIGPGGRTTAIEHDEFTLPPYTVLMNVLDCPACIIPFGRVTASDAAERLGLQPGQVVPSYNPLDLEGIPCCVQVFTSKMTDEKCLYISEVVDKCLQAKESFVVARDADE